MRKHKETGNIGEHLAAQYLIKEGYQIVATNWTSGKKEVDIIAATEVEIIFVEVKTRADFEFGFPEEAVNVVKQNLLKLAAEAYCEQHPEVKQVRFDIISIVYNQGKLQELKHFEDAFY